METLKISQKFLLAVLFSFGAMATAKAENVTAEYKCTSQCTMCLYYTKKTVCSDKYEDDSSDAVKAKKLTKFINDGLIVVDDKLKPGFNLDVFASKYFNCELMIKKANQIREAAQNMCVSKTVQVKKLVPRMPASSSGGMQNSGPQEDRSSR